MPARGHIGPPHDARPSSSFDAMRKFRDLIDLATGLILQENNFAILTEDNEYLVQE